MDEQRDYLQTQGYYIRKLNQAYFAFYGNYADTAAYSNPIGTTIQQIRNQRSSLKDFLNSVANVTSVSELDKLERDMVSRPQLGTSEEAILFLDNCSRHQYSR